MQLQLGDKVQTEKVKQRLLGPDGVVVGTRDDNSGLNSTACRITGYNYKRAWSKFHCKNILGEVDEDGFSLTHGVNYQWQTR